MFPRRLNVMGAGLTTYTNGNRSCNSEVGAGRMGSLAHVVILKLEQAGWGAWHTGRSLA